MVLVLGAGPALAQWVWLDDAGRKVFSDRAPAPTVPSSRVLKRPGQAQSTQDASEKIASDGAVAATAATHAASKPASAPLSKADQALLARKKAADDAEHAKRKAEEARAAAVRADNCRRAQGALKNLQSGRRMAQINAQGETEVMSDAARAAESQRLQGIVQADCQ
ncbi:MAG: hypothetical protein Fur007_20940 [Rhodoferax sp.]